MLYVEKKSKVKRGCSGPYILSLWHEEKVEWLILNPDQLYPSEVLLLILKEAEWI